MPTKAQLALIHVGKRHLWLTDDAYRDLLFVADGVESAKDLTEGGLERVLNQFEALGFLPCPQPRRKSRPPGGPRPGDLPTSGQLAMIRHLFEDLHWDTADRRQGFCRRMLKRPWPQTRYEANLIIEALKAMRERGYTGEATAGGP